jgi:uncharacterized membrane protein
VLLTAFGIFWGVEGAGGNWPGSDLALLGLIGGVLLAALGAVAWLRRVRAQRLAATPRPVGQPVADGVR